MSKRKKRARSVLRLEDLPNPVAIAQLDAAADAIAKQIDKELGGKPGTETIRSILPASLLLMAVRESKPGPITMQLDDGPEVEVRAVDVETFAMGMMAKSMGALMNDILAKSPTKLRLFDGTVVPPTPGASQGGSEKTSRRKGRRKTTAKKR
jgi:hypothetical protein